MPKCPKCHFQWVSTTTSDPQRAYYFGVIVDMLSEFTGDEFYDMHKILKKMFIAFLWLFKALADNSTGFWVGCW